MCMVPGEQAQVSLAGARVDTTNSKYAEGRALKQPIEKTLASLSSCRVALSRLDKNHDLVWPLAAVGCASPRRSGDFSLLP